MGSYPHGQVLITDGFFAEEDFFKVALAVKLKKVKRITLKFFE